MTETLAETRLRVRATMALERGAGFIVERDAFGSWEVWPRSKRAIVTSEYWDDAAEVESRR